MARSYKTDEDICSSCGCRLRKPKSKNAKLSITSVRFVAIKYVCSVTDKRIAARIKDAFSPRQCSSCSGSRRSRSRRSSTHAVVFNGKGLHQICAEDRLAIPNQDTGVLIGCKVCTLLRRPSWASILYHNDIFYYVLTPDELGARRNARRNARRLAQNTFSINGDAGKLLARAPKAMIPHIDNALEVYRQNLTKTSTGLVVS